MEKAGDRPDLRALSAEREEAQARRSAWQWFSFADDCPRLQLQARSGGQHRTGRAQFTLPVFNRGQELQAVGLARTRRIDQEIAATKRAVSVEVRTAYDVYNLEVAAVEELERDGLAGLEENELWRGGALKRARSASPSCYFIRRDGFDLRTIYTERLLETAVAGIQLESRAGYSNETYLRHS